MTVGMLIRNERKKQNLSLRELSEKCGVAFTMINRYEREFNNIDVQTADKILTALNVSYVIGKK